MTAGPAHPPRRDAPRRQGAPSRPGVRHRVLVAGVGDVTLSDDGFGVAVARRLAERGALPAGVEVVDFGLRARDLAFQLLDGYAALVLVDAISRGAEPGTLYALEHDLATDAASGEPAVTSLGGGHQVDPDVVLGMIVELCAAMGEQPPGRVVVVACEAASFDEAMGLSPTVAAQVDRAADAVIKIVSELVDPDLLMSPQEGATR